MLCRTLKTKKIIHHFQGRWHEVICDVADFLRAEENKELKYTYESGTYVPVGAKDDREYYITIKPKY
jgi:hypothetical protein